jgi:hypothetical protein
MAPEKALSLFCSNFIPPNAGLLSTVYEEQKDGRGWVPVLTFNTTEGNLRLERMRTIRSGACPYIGF